MLDWYIEYQFCQLFNFYGHPFSWAMLISGRVTISIFDLTHEMAVNQNMEIVDFSSDLSVQNVCNGDMFVVSGCRNDDASWFLFVSNLQPHTHTHLASSDMHDFRMNCVAGIFWAVFFLQRKYFGDNSLVFWVMDCTWLHGVCKA